MKNAKSILRIVLVVLSVASIIFFFLPFATVTTAGETVTLTGAQMSFKGTVNGLKMAVSADVWFCFILTALTVLFSALTFKFKGVRWAALVTSLASAIYMLVITLSKPAKFVDIRPLVNVTAINYTSLIAITTALLFATFALALAYLLVSDKLEVIESNGSKLPVVKRIINFFKDYKGEIKKIVWPGPRDVVKNTLIVFIICAIIGAFVWLVDLGLGQLLNLIWEANK